MARLNLQLTSHQDKELRELSKKTGASLNEIIRRAVDRYLSAIQEQGVATVMFDNQNDPEPSKAP